MSNTPMTANRNVEILMAEDNPTDLRLMRQALAHCRLPVNLNAVATGEQAMDYLRHRGAFSGSPNPDLILLDLSLPKMSGWDVLMEIKGDPDLSQIPVLIVTGSNSENDVHQAYLMNVESYIVKPLNLLEFPILVKTIERIMRQGPQNFG